MRLPINRLWLAETLLRQGFPIFCKIELFPTAIRPGVAHLETLSIQHSPQPWEGVDMGSSNPGYTNVNVGSNGAAAAYNAEEQSAMQAALQQQQAQQQAALQQDQSIQQAQQAAATSAIQQGAQNQQLQAAQIAAQQAAYTQQKDQ